jgi:hypothetical protein
MPQYNYTFQLRGWHMIFGVAILAGYFGISAWLRVRAADEAMRDSVRHYLLNRYSGRSLSDVQRILSEARDGLPVEALPPVQQRDVEFPSFSVLGKYSDAVETVRAQITVDGGAPPDGVAVRYIHVERAFTGGGWLVTGETNSYSYYSQLLP